MPSTKTKSNRRNRNPMKRLGIFQKKKQKPTPLSSQDKTGSVMSTSVENQNQKRLFSLNQIVDVGHDNDHDNHPDHDHAETSSNYVDEVDTDTDYRNNHDHYSDDDDNEHAKENMNMARNRNRNRTLKNSKTKSKSGGGLFGRKSKQKKKQTRATTKRKGNGQNNGMDATTLNRDRNSNSQTMAQEASQFPVYYSGQNSRRNSEDVMQDDAEGGVDLDVNPDAEIDLDNADADLDADADTDIGLNHNGAMKMNMNMDMAGTLRTPSPKKKNKSPFRKSLHNPKAKGNKSKSKTTSPTSTTANSPFASTSTSQIRDTSNMNSFPASSRTRSSASRSISLSAGSKSTLTSSASASASASSARRKKSKLKLKPQGLRKLNTGTFGCHAWTLFCGPKIDIPTSTVDDGNGNGNGEGSVVEKLKHQQIVDQLKVRVDVHNLSLEDRNGNGNDNDYEYGDEYTFHSRSESGSKSYASTSGNDLINDYENDNENENNSLSSQDNRKNTDIMVLARSALSRPFGRTSLPAHLAKTWMVEVAFSGYDENLGECIYNIMVQKEDYHRDRDRAGTPAPSPSRNISLSLTSSFVAANVDRTLNDFLWLEEALREEFHGSLLFPMLSLALTSGTDWTTVSEDLFDRDRFERGEWDPMKLSTEIMEEALHSDEPVDTKVLSDWLSDILNSVRGKGELILNHKMVEVVQSESMESFLYKTAGPLPRPQRKDKFGGELGDGVSNWDLIGFGKSFDLDGGEGGIQSALAGIVKANLNCLGISEDDDYLTNGQNSSTRNLDYDHAGPLFHSDRILADRTKIYQKQESSQMLLWHKMLHSKELQAQRMYIAVQKENTLRAMYRLRMLLEKEILLSAAWKRFAISLSMLFAAEKDIENNKIGRSRSKISTTLKNKIGRTKVDDHLRVLARQKQDRSIPSLKVLSGMLNAYYSDFSTVDPSLLEYVQGLEMLTMSTDSDDSWQSHFKALSPINLLRSDSIPSTVGNAKIEKFAIQGRLNTNEEYMKSSLEQACMAIKIRVSRMSWKYFKMESGQVSLLLSAAEQARSNLKYTRSRSHTHIPSSLEEEKEDNEREIDLVRLIMELGLKKKYKYSPLPKSSSSSAASHTSSSSETSVISDVDRSPSLSLSLDDNETTTTGTFTDDGGTLQSPLLEPVMSMARGNAGRWNEDLAKSVLEASGIPSHSFDSDESLSTKNIRAVSKLVTSLRESVDRCQEAVNMLSEIENNSMEGDVAEDGDKENHNHASLHKLRNSFLDDLALVFSGTCRDDSSSSSSTSTSTSQSSPSHNNISNSQYEHKQILTDMGVDIHDSAGWLPRSQSSSKSRSRPSNRNARKQGTCGNITLKYQRVRGHGSDEFLKRMTSRLKSYDFLIEEIENYIWMNKVGNYVEKFYSNVRADAVSAWEKKTDITTAINIATKKRLTLLVKELKQKLELIGSNGDVSYSSVKEAKERHLGSKALKVELEALASRRLKRLCSNGSCVEYSLSIIHEWSLREEASTKLERKCLKDVIGEIERNVRRNENEGSGSIIKADGGAHLFARSTISTAIM